MDRVEQILNSIFLETTFILLVIASILAFFIGLVILVSPRILNKLQRFSDYQISLRKALKPLDIPRNKERFYYRHHKLFGVVLLVGSSFSLSTLVMGNHAQQAIDLLSTYSTRAILEFTIQSAQIFLFIGNLFAFAIGLIIFIRPSLLKNIESKANHWITARPYTRKLETFHPELEQHVMSHSRIYGLLLIIASIYIASNLLFYSNMLM